MTGAPKARSKANGKPELRNEMQIGFVPLPPDRVMTWRSGMAEVYKVLEEALARERAAVSGEEAQ